jgi:hypothetical protein
MDITLKEKLKQNFRQDVIEVLELISSKEKQLDYQKNVPIAYVSAELFNQWEDCYQIPREQKWYSEAFTEKELEVLAVFNRSLEHISACISKNPPDIAEFVEAPEWLDLSKAAIAALKRLNEISNPS